MDKIEELCRDLQAEDAQVRLEAVRILSLQLDPRSVAPLIEALRDPYFMVRGDAAKLLGRLHAREAVPALITLLDDPEVNMTAGRALGSIGDPAAVPYLLKFLDHENFYHREMAAGNLGLLRERDTFEVVARLLEDEHPVVRFAALSAVINIGEAHEIDVKPYLEKMLNDPDESVRTFAWLKLSGKI